jgi:plastocyanin
MTRLISSVVVVVALALAGCGGNNNASSGSSGSSSSGGSSGSSTSTSASSGGGSTLALAADPNGGLSFDKKVLTAKAGSVTIDFTNDSSTPHAVAVEGHGIDKDGKTITKSKEALTVPLKKGTYTFYCPVPGHRQAGMVGKIIVR